MLPLSKQKQLKEDFFKELKEFPFIFVNLLMLITILESVYLTAFTTLSALESVSYSLIAWFALFFAIDMFLSVRRNYLISLEVWHGIYSD